MQSSLQLYKDFAPHIIVDEPTQTAFCKECHIELETHAPSSVNEFMRRAIGFEYEHRNCGRGDMNELFCEGRS